MFRALPGLLLAAVLLAPAPQDKAPEFDLLYLAVHGRRQDTVSFDFNGDGRGDILNTAIDYDAEPPVRWFFLHYQTKEGSYPEKPDQVWKISDRAAAMMYGDFVPGGGVDVCFAAPDGVYYYPFENGKIVETPEKLLHRRTFFSQASDRAIPIWWIPWDLDGNKLHDLILPVPGAYRVYFQTKPGEFGSVVQLEADIAKSADKAMEISRFASSNDFIASFFGRVNELPRFAISDVDGDGRQDLISIEGHLLTIFFQRKPRQFIARRPHRVRFPVAALKDKLKKDTVSLSMVALPDIDGDKLADLVVTKVEGQLGFLESIKTNIYVHRGTGRGNFVADFVIKIDGVSIDPNFRDMNGDGTQDCLVSRLRTDLLAQAIQAAVLGDIGITYEIFQYDKKTGRYQETPVYQKDIYVTTDDIQKKGAASVPMVYVQGDHSGDGRPDMVNVDPKTQVLTFRKGIDTRFGSRRQIGFDTNAFYKTKLRRHPNGIMVYELNGDKFADAILMHHGTLGLVLSRKSK